MNRIACLLLALAAAMPAVAQQPPPNQTTMEKAGDIAKQPGRDVGVVKTKVPPLLIEVQKDPYTLRGLSRCNQIAAAFDELNTVLGPDFTAGTPLMSKRRIKVTGDTVAGLIVPFRGVIREVSGAARAQRALNNAVDAGIARRGFLRGVYQSRRCQPAL